MTGRDANKLETFVEALAAEGFDRDAMLPVVGVRPTRACRTNERAVAAFGPIDVLVNNAGGPGPRRTLRDIPSRTRKSAPGRR